VHSPDHDAFTVFFEKEYRSIVAMVMRAGATLDDAEDAVIETMSLGAGRFPELENPGAWTRKVALRRFIRKTRRDRERVNKEQLAAHPVEELDLDDGDLLRLVRKLIEHLPPAQRQVMAYHLDDCTTAEIACLMGSPPDTVRSNLRHARRALALGLHKVGWRG
jgi:RNA polymerase sigma factor (sigma-70 family)